MASYGAFLGGLAQGVETGLRINAMANQAKFFKEFGDVLKAQASQPAPPPTQAIDATPAGALAPAPAVPLVTVPQAQVAATPPLVPAQEQTSYAPTTAVGGLGAQPLVPMVTRSPKARPPFSTGGLGY
jgi:hypothetical protein